MFRSDITESREVLLKRIKWLMSLRLVLATFSLGTAALIQITAGKPYLEKWLASPDKELYVGIRWNGGYQLYVPEQEGEMANVHYRCADDVVVELHSHPRMAAQFSGTDNKDEQGLKVYGVVNREAVNLRVGVYGYWMFVEWSDIFDGLLQGVWDLNESVKEGKGGDILAVE